MQKSSYTDKRFRALTLCVFLLLMQGCAKKLEGEAFTEKGKLGGLRIYVVNSEKAKPLIQETRQDLDNKKQVILRAVQTLEWREIYRLSNEIGPVDPMGKIEKLREKLEKEVKKIDAKTLYKDLKALETHRFYFEKLKELIETENTTKTLSDGDGRFSVNAHPDSFLIAVSADKAKLWILDTSKIQVKLQLTEHNTAGKDCIECLITSDDDDINRTGPLSMILYLAAEGPYKQGFLGIVDYAKKAGLN